MRHLSVFLVASLFSTAAFAADAPTAKSNEAPATQQVDSMMRVTEGSGGKSTSSLIEDAPLRGDYVMGNDSAKLVIVEYASLSCPHCAAFSNSVLPEIQKNYIDTGKVKYVLRPFPLNDPALKAAILLECVGEQNHKMYYVFAKVLFDAQNKWAFDGNFMSGLETIAAVGGLTREQFQNCVSNTDREMTVLKIKKAATDELKVPHTPYFFIAGEVYAGETTYNAMAKFIDAKLAQIDAKKN